MKNLFIAACCCLASAGFAAEPFEIRGVLPWHNFLCGPTAWNKADYEVYLDNCKAEGINFIGFHNYTGGGERYATYVEPMVRISDRGIVPQAMLDNSLGCRWGALPLRLKEFAFGSQRALDDLLENYPDIDYVWLWLNEHSFLGVVVEQALGDPAFAEVFRRESGHFEEAQSDSERFVGVWSLEYIRRTLDHLRQKGSRAKLIIGGWGGGGQLPGILRGLDRALPEEVVFSCLNPDLGRTRQPGFLADIARHRKVWAVPWLEGDNQMWHQQPRVGKMRDHVQLAREQGLQGVAAIHWRTAETRYNFRTFARYARTSDDTTVETLYKEYFEEDFGAQAAAALAPLMAAVDTANAWEGPQSPEYFAFRPDWGVLDEANAASRQGIIDAIDAVQDKEQTPQQRRDLKSFRAMLSFELLLDKVVRAMAPGWELRDKTLAENRPASREACAAALRELESAPVEELIRTYVSRTGSRGEMGILTSINQRLWNNYLLLKNYLQENTH